MIWIVCSSMAKILLVEDDPMAAASVKSLLLKEGHLPEWTDNGEDALQLCRNFDYDLILLDWSLPGISGFEVCTEYRRMGGKSWLIFLTSMGEIDFKEKGLNAGADDYLVKPVDLRELAARVRGVFRRSDPQQYQAELKIGDVLLDVSTRSMIVHEQNVRLMRKEAAVLEYLMRNPNKLASTKKLLRSVWTSESDASEGAVRTCMFGLRQKLEACGKAEFIKTVPGSGYMIETEPQAE